MDSVFCGMLRPSSKIEGSQKMPNNRRGRNSLAARNHFYKKSRLHDFGTQQIRFQWTQRSDPKRVFLAPNHCRIPTSWSKTWVSPLVQLRNPKHKSWMHKSFNEAKPKHFGVDIGRNLLMAMNSLSQTLTGACALESGAREAQGRSEGQGLLQGQGCTEVSQKTRATRTRELKIGEGSGNFSYFYWLIKQQWE